MDRYVVLSTQFRSYTDSKTGEVKSYGRVKVFVPAPTPDVVEFAALPELRDVFSAVPGVYDLDTYGVPVQAERYGRQTTIVEMRVRGAVLIGPVDFQPGKK